MDGNGLCPKMMIIMDVFFLNNGFIMVYHGFYNGL